ncbi:MAG: ATP/GTP-binding protein [Thermoplasmata archaeon]
MPSEDPGTIYFSGTAGAGKTSLVIAFNRWLETNGYNSVVVNLDPGNENPDFQPDIDIRDWVRLSEVMQDHGLGPNGAQVAAADMIALKIFDVKQVLSGFRSDFVLVDTPGQVELFAFRESSRAIVEALSGDRSMIAFLFDPALARTASGFVSLLMFSATVEFRFRLATLNLLTKCDILSSEQSEQIVGWGDDVNQLYDAITQESPTPDVQLATEMFRAMETMAPLATLIPTSGRDGTGMEQLYRAVQRSFSGGEDADSPEPAPSE